MKKKILYSLIIFHLNVSLILILATVFIIDNSLVNGIVSSKYFWFYGNMGLLSIATVFYSFLKKNHFRYTPSDGLIIILIINILSLAWVFNVTYMNTTKLIIVVLLFVLYICLRLILEEKNQKITKYLCLFVILTGLVEAIWGLLQLYGIQTSQHKLFKLTGSFFNSGPFAGYLAIVFPLTLKYYWENHNLRFITKSVSIDGIQNLLNFFKIRTIINFLIPFIKKWLGGITSIAILLVLPATMSRASWIAAISGSIVVITGQWKGIHTLKNYFLKSKIKGFRIIAFILITVLLISSFTGMYYLKKDSADGRLLMWKVSLYALAQNPLGIGLGHFSNAYGEAQEAYFASGNASETEKFVAGNPEYGFNEFLQISIESGILALMLFIGMLVCAFRGLIKSKNWGMMGSLVALLVFSCFSYPFSVLPFLIIFVFLLAMSTINNAQITQVRKTNENITAIRTVRIISIPICCLIVTAFCLWKQYPVYNAYKQWKSYQMYYQTGMYKDATWKYESLYPYLNDQIQFLFEYGRSLSQSEQPEKSNVILQHAMQISCDPMLYNIMGKNYQALKEYDLAEKSFRKSSLIVPNRIYPYYLLMKLHIETGNLDKAIANATIVLTKEPKVQSTAVKEMRVEARKLIGN